MGSETARSGIMQPEAAGSGFPGVSRLMAVVMTNQRSQYDCRFVGSCDAKVFYMNEAGSGIVYSTANVNVFFATIGGKYRRDL